MVAKQTWLLVPLLQVMAGRSWPRAWFGIRFGCKLGVAALIEMAFVHGHCAGGSI